MRTALRRAGRIRYTAARIEESRWGRRLVGMMVVAAVVLGAIGWYRHLMRPPVVAPPATASSRAAAQAGAAPTAPVASSAAVGGDAAPPAEPVTLSAQGLMDEIRHDPALAPALVFDKLYKNREVTWSGTVTTVSPPDGKLLHFEFKDSDGIHVAAWCLTEAQLGPGAAVTVRGRLASQLNDGFVVEQCQIR